MRHGFDRLCALLLLAIVLSPLAWDHDARAGSQFVKRTTLLYHVTRNDTLVAFTNWLNLKGANRARVILTSDHSGVFTGSDSTYSDSLLTIAIYRSNDDSTYTSNFNADSLVANGTTNYQADYSLALYSQDAIGVGTTASLRRANPPGGGRVMFLWPVFQPVGVGTVDPLPIFFNSPFRLGFRPYTRNTLSGNVSTTPNRTRGIKGLTVVLEAYYENP